jgi:hypothetical protein
MISSLISDAATPKTGVRAPLQKLTGFFFAFRICIIYLGFQSDPRSGTAVSLMFSGCLLACGIVYTLGDKDFSSRLLRRSPTNKWLLAYLGLTAASLLWTAASSPAIAGGYWVGMAMDVITVTLLLKAPDLSVQVDALMKGFVFGSLAVAAVAWLAPALANSRIGDDEFLHPNNLGLEFGIAFFLAQYLAMRDRIWNLGALVLSLSLLRTISKTSITAFLIAETLYIVRDRQISRWAKVRIAAIAMLAVAASAGFIGAYTATYIADADSAETLTGRTTIWARSFLMALEHPWLGHGIFSYHALIPAFGKLEPLHAHNELLQQFFEYGALGLAVTLALHFSLFRAGWRLSPAPYARLSMVLVLFALIRGMADTINIGLSLPLWLFAALAIAMTHTSQEPVEARS